LTAKQRKRLPKSSFAIPSERKYPIHDKSHARNALSRSAREKPGRRRLIRSRVYKRYPSLKKT
jgi:hypothetical protein